MTRDLGPVVLLLLAIVIIVEAAQRVRAASPVPRSIRACWRTRGSNDRHDPGGRTPQGITPRLYDSDRAERGLEARTIVV